MLQDWHVVILRPKHQAQRLVECLQADNAQTKVFPLIDIIPLDYDGAQLAIWRECVQSADYFIVTSANAVHCAPAALMSAMTARAFILTMGQATTDALQTKNPSLKVNFTAPLGSTSESVLMEDFLQPHHIAHKKVVILAGLDGRTVLADTLSRRGAQIEWIKVYKQEKPLLSLTPLIQDLQSQTNVCFIATSSRIVENLLALTSDNDKPWLLKQPLIVVSDRIYQQAKAWGFERIGVANGASDGAIRHACKALLVNVRQ